MIFTTQKLDNFVMILVANTNLKSSQHKHGCGFVHNHKDIQQTQAPAISQAQLIQDERWAHEIKLK